jgi:hypothetical protein
MLTALLIARVGLDRAGLSTGATVAVVAGLVVATGTASEAVWEIYEWRVMWSFSSSTIVADYPDTMRDLFAGLAGSTVAGTVFALLRTYDRLRRPRDVAFNTKGLPKVADTPS